MPRTPIHLLVDFRVTDATLLHRPSPGVEYLREAVVAGGSTVLSEHTHQFEPCGYSGMLLLAESHASIHTWVDENLISIDVFACGPIDVDVIMDTLRERFRPEAERVERRQRGVVPPSGADGDARTDPAT